MSDRLDDLLAHYLETGDMPAATTQEERAEIVALAAAASRAAAVQPNLAHETRVTTPTARARFERFVAANAEASPPPRARRSEPWWQRTLGRHRMLAFTGSAAALGVITLVALFIVQNLSSTTETASAAVLTPGDYAQVEGTISDITAEDSGRTLTLDSVLGRLEVALPPGAAVLSADGTPSTSADLQPGDPVAVGGLVLEDRTLAGQTIARRTATEAGADGLRFTTEPPDILQGVIRLVSVGEGERLGLLVVVNRDGRFVVPISGTTAARLLASDTTLLGAAVTATRESGTRLYSVDLVTPAASGDRLFVRITGTLVSRTANVLMVETERGIVPVVIRRETRILLGESGLTLAGVAGGETALGHELTVDGSNVPGTRRVAADVIVVGPKPPR